MTQRLETMTHAFVEFIPDVLEEGVVYVSVRYRVVTHLCPCGCGERVVTPLHPAQWTLSFDGETVSLSPSIGGGGCNSHYFITRGKVRWAPPLTEQQRVLAAERDEAALQIGFGAWADDDEPQQPDQATDANRTKPNTTKRGRWERVKRFFSR
jgi:Family of unknown function (DUF6527)